MWYLCVYFGKKLPNYVPKCLEVFSSLPVLSEVWGALSLLTEYCPAASGILLFFGLTSFSMVRFKADRCSSLVFGLS